MAWTERFCRADAAGGGDGSTDTNSGGSGAWTLAEAVTNEAAGMRINVKAGTYANTTTTRTLAANGTTTAPIWWRGFNTTPGDLDISHALPLPSLTFTTGRVVVSGNHHVISNLDLLSASTSGATINPTTSTQSVLWRIRAENTGANANSQAVSATSGTAGLFVGGCWLKSTSSASVLSTNATIHAIGNVLRGGANGILSSTTSSQSFLFNVFDGNGGNGILATAAIITAIGNSFYNPTSDGIEFTGAGSGLITNNLFVNCGAYGFNNSSGTNSNQFRLLANGFYGNTSGNVNGITEGAAITDDLLVALLNVQLGSNPFTDAPNHDFSVTSAAKALGFPGVFENESYIGYLDLGTVQRQEPTGGGEAISPSPISANSWHNIG